MNTANRRLAAANLQKTRRAAGWTKRTTWFDPASSAKLEALKRSIGSYDEAIRQAIMGWEGPSAADKPATQQTLAAAEKANTILRSALGIQIGPVEPKPGSRLKVKK